jgi:hypothetical protein
MEQILSDDVKNIIVKITKNPEYAKQVDSTLLYELVEMDVFYFNNGLFKPNTSIFLENDIINISDIVNSLSNDMVRILTETTKYFTITSPNLKNFIYVIIGMGQGLHKALKNLGASSEWQTKTGKYERSRVDFNEDCAAYHAFGKDLHNKNVVKGEKYTRVTVGYNLKDEVQISDIDVNDESMVITCEQSKKYKKYIDKISIVCSEYYSSKLEFIENSLLLTTSGKSGAPVKNMMVNFWRYMRKSIAVKLYENNYLTDNIPQEGNYTIFYENEIGYFD